MASQSDNDRIDPDDNSPPPVPFLHALDELGALVQTFGPSKANMLAGLVIGALGLLVGGSLVAWMIATGFSPYDNERPGPDKHLPVWLGSVFAVVGSGIAIAGLSVAVWVVRHFSFRVYVCSRGFGYTASGGIVVFLWDQIKEVEERIVQKRIKVASAAEVVDVRAPFGKDTSYRVRHRAGREFTFTENTLKRHRKLGRLIQEEARRRGIPCHTAEEDDGPLEIPFIKLNNRHRDRENPR